MFLPVCLFRVDLFSMHMQLIGDPFLSDVWPWLNSAAAAAVVVVVAFSSFALHTHSLVLYSAYHLSWTMQLDLFTFNFGQTWHKLERERICKQYTSEWNERLCSCVERGLFCLFSFHLVAVVGYSFDFGDKLQIVMVVYATAQLSHSTDWLTTTRMTKEKVLRHLGCSDRYFFPLPIEIRTESESERERDGEAEIILENNKKTKHICILL